jgi:hypothetical protein
MAKKSDLHYKSYIWT